MWTARMCDSRPIAPLALNASETLFCIHGPCRIFRRWASLVALHGEMHMAKTNNPLVSIIDRRLDVSNFREQHWEGTFWEYLDAALENPSVARNAFQRVYDMILSYGSENFTQFKQEYNRYKFFADPIDHGADAIYGLEKPLMTLVDFFKSAAQGYGTEKRILLLHGPVGSSKSTIARLLKKGLEAYSKIDVGKVYTYMWRVPKTGPDGDEGEHYLD